MHRSLRIKILLWFGVIVAAVAFAGFAGFERLARYVRTEAEQQMTAKLEHVVDVLETTNATYQQLVASSMQVLKMIAAEDGPAARGPGKGELSFGGRAVNGTSDIVDRVQEIMGGTATLFVYDGRDFIRVSTNVRTASGDRATGTTLESRAAERLAAGEDFSGVVDILGKPYITAYAPIRDADGRLIGAYYVGYALETLGTIRDSFEDRGVLESGFFALLDPSDRVVLHTHDIGDLSVLERVARAFHVERKTAPGWFVEQKDFAPWDYTVVGAMYLPDIRWITWEFIWQVYSVGAVVIVLALLASFWLASRLSHALETAEEARAEALAARDAAESANRTKSAFLANMSHELRTPMNAIIGYSEMLIEEAEDRELPDFTPDLNKIRSAGKHLLGLINDVLDLSKIEAGKMTLYVETFDVRAMVDDVAATIQPLIDKNGNRLVIDCPAPAGSMRTDLTKVRQTLFNLLGNATKFTQNGLVTLRVTRNGGRIQFSVADTGIGMSDEQVSRLFQAFTQADESTTRKYGGTGLGLVISRKFCEMLGGSIRVESTPGTGTTFTVDLPDQVESAPVPPASRPSPTPSQRRLVLIIDDDPDATDLLARHLTKAGYDVLKAHSGSEGLQLARDQKPAAITLDVMMPGMDGWTVLTALKSDAATADIPVLIVTMLQESEMGFSLGAAEFLTKPVEQKRLTGLLRKHAAVPAAHVLIVDDDGENRALLRRFVEREGFSVEEAENGAVGLERLAARTPAVILLDLMMPVMDGFAFLESLRQMPAFQAVPVIVITAKDLTEHDRSILRGRVEQIVQKGAIDRDSLLKQIASLIDRTS